MFGKKISKTLFIEGMHCDGCAKRVINALNALKEVKEVQVNLEGKRAFVMLKKELPNEVLIEAVQSLGFIVTNIE